MLEVVFFCLLIAFPLIGAGTRRWLAVALPLVGWPVFSLGLDNGWWLDGTGDGWQYAAAGATLLGLASTALAVGIARPAKAPSHVGWRAL
jgi:hypothetical protein